MNILINGLSAVVGGGVTYLSNMIPALAKIVAQNTEHTISLICRNEVSSNFATTAAIRLLPMHSDNLRGVKRLIWEKRYLGKIASDIGADVVFTPTQTGFSIKGKKNVMMLRNMEPFLHRDYKYSPKSRLRNVALNRYTRHALTNADRVIAVSDYVAEYAAVTLGIAESKISRIYHGRDKGFADSSKPTDSQVLSKFDVNGPYIFSCGSILPYRQCEVVIGAYNLTRNNCHRDLSLIIAGKGTDARYAHKVSTTVRSSPYSASIRMLGHVDPEIMKVLYRNAEAFVTATEIEACPNIIIEALTSGCPIVSGDSPPMPEFIQDAGLLYTARNVNGAAACLEETLQDSELRAQLAEKARLRATNFDWDNTAQETLRALTEW